MTKKQMPKRGFQVGAGGSFRFSVCLSFSGSRQEVVFVGLWVPSILSSGTLILGRKSHE